MDPNSKNIFDIWKGITTLAISGEKELDNTIQEQTLKLDIVYNTLLQNIPKHINYEPDKKKARKQSKVQNDQIGDLFAVGPNFQQPTLPPIRRTRRQASMLAMEKTKDVGESTTISSRPSTRNHCVKDLSTIISGPSTRASRARALSTLINSPIANSTFVVDKKGIGNVDQCVSPQMFPSEHEITYIKPAQPNTTYNKRSKSSVAKATKKNEPKICSVPEESPMNIENSNGWDGNSTAIMDLKTKSDGSKKTDKRREKLEDIDVNNIEKPPAQHLTRTMKRKLQEENLTGAKKTNVNQVPLEQKISTPLKSLESLLPTPHQVRENEAEKRKEQHLKTKADQRKFDNQQLKVAKHKEENFKLLQEKIKRKEEERKKKEEKLKEKELMLKEEALKKQKQAELRLAEINAKRLQAEQARAQKMQQIEMSRRKLKDEMNRRKLKEDEIKKKPELKLEKNIPVLPKAVTSIPVVSKEATKIKIEKTGINQNDYGLNDVSARDSSDDESGPKKPVPIWAKKENRNSVLELQYHVDSEERDLFFDCPKSMSLKEMFKGWKIRDKQRTSSAVWNTPPRYSEYIRRYN